MYMYQTCNRYINLINIYLKKKVCKCTILPAMSQKQLRPGRTYVDHMSKDKGLYPSFRPYGKVLVILPIVSWFHYEMGTSAAVIPRSNGKK